MIGIFNNLGKLLDDMEDRTPRHHRANPYDAYYFPGGKK